MGQNKFIFKYKMKGSEILVFDQRLLDQPDADHNHHYDSHKYFRYFTADDSEERPEPHPNRMLMIFTLHEFKRHGSEK